MCIYLSLYLYTLAVRRYENIYTKKISWNKWERELSAICVFFLSISSRSLVFFVCFKKYTRSIYHIREKGSLIRMRKKKSREVFWICFRVKMRRDVCYVKYIGLKNMNDSHIFSKKNKLPMIEIEIVTFTNTRLYSPHSSKMKLFVIVLIYLWFKNWFCICWRFHFEFLILLN